MSKRKKLEKIHTKIMCASEQIKVLSKYIGFYTDTAAENQVFAELINEKSRQIFKANEKIGRIFKL